MSFKIGNTVEVIDDAIKGKVIAVEKNNITIETDDGFPMQFHPSELVLVEENLASHITNYSIQKAVKDKETPKRKQATARPRKERDAPKMEVDLHIHQLTNQYKGLSNYDMLTLQLDTAKRQLEFAISKRIQKVVFIHGVGAGVLKEELKYLFGRYDNVSFYDADYQKYGLGATEVYIYQNPK